MMVGSGGVTQRVWGTEGRQGCGFPGWCLLGGEGGGRHHPESGRQEAASATVKRKGTVAESSDRTCQIGHGSDSLFFFFSFPPRSLKPWRCGWVVVGGGHATVTQCLAFLYSWAHNFYDALIVFVLMILFLLQCWHCFVDPQAPVASGFCQYQAFSFSSFNVHATLAA